MISKTSTVTPYFFAFLAKVDHYLSAWQVKKKSVRGNVLGANVLKLHAVSDFVCVCRDEGRSGFIKICKNFFCV